MTELERRAAGDLTKRIDMGFAFQQFIKGDLGRHLLERAEADRASFAEELIACSREDVEKFKDAELRMKIMAIDMWQQWMADALKEGEVAQIQLLELEQTTGG